MPQTRKQRKAAAAGGSGTATPTPSPKTPRSLRGPAPAVQAPTGTPTPSPSEQGYAGLKNLAAQARSKPFTDAQGYSLLSETVDTAIRNLTPSQAEELHERLLTIKRRDATQGAHRKAQTHIQQPLREICEAWPAFEHIYCNSWMDPHDEPHHCHNDPYVCTLAETGYDKEDPSLESVRAQTLICASLFEALIEDMSILSEVSLHDVRRIRKTSNDATLFDLRERLWNDAARFKIIYEMENMGPDEEQEHDRARDQPFSRRHWMGEARKIEGYLIGSRTIIQAKFLEDANSQYTNNKLSGDEFRTWVGTMRPRFRQVAAIKWSLVRANEQRFEPPTSFEFDEGLDVFEGYLASISAYIDWLDDFDTGAYLAQESESESESMPTPDSPPAGKNSPLFGNARGSVAPLFGKPSLDVQEFSSVPLWTDMRHNRA